MKPVKPTSVMKKSSACLDLLVATDSAVTQVLISSFATVSRFSFAIAAFNDSLLICGKCSYPDLICNGNSTSKSNTYNTTYARNIY